jgi:hypothetical protein
VIVIVIMKFSSILAVASVLQLGAAFAPAPLSRQSTPLNMIDPSQLPDVIHHADALRVVFMECNQEGCAMAEGVKDSTGWHVSGGLEAGAGGEVKKVLMMEMEDTE